MALSYAFPSREQIESMVKAGERVRKALAEAAQAIVAVYERAGRKINDPETLARYRYQVMIERERSIGRSFVREEFRRLREELGLPENTGGKS